MQDTTIGNKALALTATQSKRTDQPTSPSRRQLVRDISFAVGAAAVGAAGLARAASSAHTPSYDPHLAAHPANASMAASNDLTFPFQDPLNDVKAIIQLGLAFAPEPAGAILDVLLELFWPENEGNVWDSIKSQVAGEIANAIYQNNINSQTDYMMRKLGDTSIQGGFLALLARLQDDMNGTDPKNNPRIPERVKSLLDLFTFFSSDFQPSDAVRDGQTYNPDTHQPGAPFAVQTLPLFVQFANLHILFLRDQVLNGDKFGLSDALRKECLADLQEALRGVGQQGKPGYIPSYQKYVDMQMDAGRRWYEAKYQSRRKYVKEEGPDFFAGSMSGSARASGAWEAKKTQNAALTYLEHTVVDFRKLWDLILDNNGNVNPHPPQLTLNREVYLGPYGIPDLRDVDVWYWDKVMDYFLDGNCNGECALGKKIINMDPPIPDVPGPKSAVTENPIVCFLIPFVTLNEYGRWWCLPRWDNPKIARVPASHGSGSWNDYFKTQDCCWMETIEAWGGEVIGIEVATSWYIRRNLGYMGCTGEMISGLRFTSKNGSVFDHGWTPDEQKEIKRRSQQTVPVPKDHVLSGITPISGTAALWHNMGYDGWNTISSMTFGFKLKNQVLKLSMSLLKTVYKTSLAQMTLTELSHFATKVYHDRNWDINELTVLDKELAQVSKQQDWHAARAEYHQTQAKISAKLQQMQN
jgi:hypothetical protein